MQTEQNSTCDSKTPFVSFIITDYNVPIDILRQCLESVLSVSLLSTEREIILIDDGSKESPLSSLADIYNEIIFLRQNNQGLAAARNKGLSIATGEYIQFIDGDDVLLYKPYNLCLDIIRSKVPDILLFSFTSKGKTNKHIQYSLTGPITGSSFLHTHNLRAAVWGYTFKRGLLGTLRFSVGFLHEDEEFTPLLFLKADNIYIIDTIVYYYRQSENSIMHNNSPQHVMKLLSDKRKIIYHLQNISLTLPITEKKALDRRIAQLAMDYLYDTIKLTKSFKYMDIAINHLTKIGLFPLPDKKYTNKYYLLKKMVESEFGRKALFFICR